MGFKEMFGKALPFLATALPLPPPFGAMAARFIGEKLGIADVTPANIDDVIAKATAADPDAMLKLKQAEDAFALQMQQLGFDQVDKLLSIDAADRANARAREVAVKDKVPMLLAFIAVIGLYCVVGAVMKWDIPPAAHDLLLILIGALVANVNSVYQYYFGSSSGSASKTAIMAAQAGAAK